MEKAGRGHHVMSYDPNNSSIEQPKPKEDPQLTLLDVSPDWAAHWEGMPEFKQEDATPDSAINVQFRTAEDRRAFLEMLGENPARLKSIWWPQLDYLQQSAIVGDRVVKVPQNRYPIFVISKGRWDTRLTVRALEKLGLDFRVVIEPQELEQYSAVIDPAKLLLLPFSNLGQGSIPARNWVWEYSRSIGAARHWILDDNIDGFYRLNDNLKKKVIDENPFTPVEDFVDRYENVPMAGMQYEFFAPRRSQLPPFVWNTRVYSCILLSNTLDLRWRGRYNEDTDLSLRILKSGACTVLFNAYLCKKMPTMTMKGGNTDTLYKEDGRMKMARSLQEQHPDVVKITEKWGRPQHHVDYKAFRDNKPVMKGGAK